MDEKNSLSAGIDINIDPSNYLYIGLAITTPLVIFLVLKFALQKL